MRFALQIAWSHLKGRRRTVGVSAIGLVAVLGVTVGVTALIMVLAVMEGFEIDLREKILGSNAHVVVLHFDGYFDDYEGTQATLEGIDGVAASAPFIYTKAMIQGRFGHDGVVVKGLDVKRTQSVTNVRDVLTVGPLGALTSMEERAGVFASLRDPPRAIAQPADDTEALPGIIVGTKLAETMSLFPGDRVHLINPAGGGTGPFGSPIPKVKPFRLAAVFESGMYEYDTGWTYVAKEDLQQFLGVADVVTGYEIRGHDIEEAGAIKDRIDRALGYPFYTNHWKKLNQSLFEALALEKVVMGLILSLIVLVASLNIVGMLVLVVVTRTREISILRAMGASAMRVRQIFMLEGLLIGLVGTAIGTVLGLVGCEALKNYEFPLDTDVYYVDTLPVVVQYDTVAVVALVAVLICFAATLYPATIAARIRPVDGLRYE
ncbi:MAG: ABC transporter permease [Myxococcota bacterium]|nr:ABC transporter permease [Myxococcota bacterium]MEC9390355.1 ABC transporter permease [Myxococcota bacterium]